MSYHIKIIIERIISLGVGGGGENLCSFCSVSLSPVLNKMFIVCFQLIPNTSS